MKRKLDRMQSVFHLKSAEDPDRTLSALVYSRFFWYSNVTTCTKIILQVNGLYIVFRTSSSSLAISFYLTQCLFPTLLAPIEQRWLTLLKRWLCVINVFCVFPGLRGDH